MIRKEKIGNSTEEFTNVECDECPRLVIYPGDIKKKDIMSGGWKIGKDNGCLCPKCSEKDNNNNIQENP